MHDTVLSFALKNELVWAWYFTVFIDVFICCPKVMRIVEALEGKGCRMPLMKGEVELAEKLATITRQVGGPWLCSPVSSCALVFFGFVKKVHSD